MIFHSVPEERITCVCVDRTGRGLSLDEIDMREVTRSRAVSLRSWRPPKQQASVRDYARIRLLVR